MPPTQSPLAPQARRRARRATALALAGVALALTAAGCGHSQSVPKQLGFSPAPGTPVASPQTQITVRGAAPPQLRDFTVAGSRSGSHTGRIVRDPDGPDTTFLPARPFDPGEQVEVSLRVAGRLRAIRFHFEVAQPASVTFAAGPPAKPTRPGQVQHFRSRPDLRPPTISVDADSTATAHGDIFLGPANKLGQAGPLIVDDRGQPIWFHPLPGKLQAFGFREQHYRRQQVLTWWQGVVSTVGYGHGEDVVYSRSYRRIATVRAGNGYQADLHEFVITPQNTALITAYNPVRADLSSLGGARDGTVLDCVLQELDIKTGRVLFEWHSLGNVDLDESYSKPVKGQPFDYFHLNSIALDGDDNLIISARNTWTVYEINRHTGKILWRLGGKDSSFTMEPGTQFAYQHDAERQPDGTITVFDNGSNPQVHPESRAIALALDMNNMTATLARDWKHPSKILTGSQGNVQTLSNGDRFVGWGGQPNLTEFSPSGQVLFDAAMAAPDTSYRAYRFPWSGRPPGRPVLSATRTRGGRLAVYISWNGATNVARWRILAGPDPQSLSPAGDAARTGFETRAVLASQASYVAAEALSAAGRVLGVSVPVQPAVS